MDKPRGKWTLEEAKKYCEGRGSPGCCVGCRFADDSEECVIAAVPENWEIAEENYATAATDTNVGHKPDKPRLAEVLGVEVDKKFRIFDSSDRFWVDKYGVANAEKMDDEDAAIWVMFAINHPNNIVRSCLTEAELDIMRTTGAKWVSREKKQDCPDCECRVTLWWSRPCMTRSGVFANLDGCDTATMPANLFPSVHPGDCICVEEAGDDGKP